MTNHIAYLQKTDEFWVLPLIIYIFKNSDNALLLWLIINDFFPKYNGTGVFNQWDIGNGHAASFQNKMYIKFQKI